MSEKTITSGSAPEQKGSTRNASDRFAENVDPRKSDEKRRAFKCSSSSLCFSPGDGRGHLESPDELPLTSCYLNYINLVVVGGGGGVGVGGGGGGGGGGGISSSLLLY